MVAGLEARVQLTNLPATISVLYQSGYLSDNARHGPVINQTDSRTGLKIDNLSDEDDENNSYEY